MKTPNIKKLKIIQNLKLKGKEWFKIKVYELKFEFKNKTNKLIGTCTIIY
jgi:hypothetical protein